MIFSLQVDVSKIFINNHSDKGMLKQYSRISEQ